MANWDNVGYPGTAVFKGMSAASDWNRRALNNIDIRNQLQDWDNNERVRELRRLKLEDDLNTAYTLGRTANEATRKINELRTGLYDESGTGYMKALDALRPLSGGASRRLSKDKKTIETVGVDGTVLGTTPNRTGKMAERALLYDYGTSLSSELSELFPREARESKLQLQMALAENAARDKQQETMMRLLAGSLGIGGLGGRSGRSRGGFGGGSGAGGSNPFSSGLDTTDFERTRTELYRRAADIRGLGLTKEGAIDPLGLPEDADITQLNKDLSTTYQELQAYYMQFLKLGQQPGLAMYNAEQALRRNYQNAASAQQYAAAVERSQRAMLDMLNARERERKATQAQDALQKNPSTYYPWLY